MEPTTENIVLALSLGAVLFFCFGYFIALSPFNYRARLSRVEDDELDFERPQTPAPPSELPAKAAAEASVPKYEPALENARVDEFLQHLARVYKAQEIAIFDGDGLIVQGSSVDPELALRVAGLSQARSLSPRKPGTARPVYYREGEVGVHSLDCETQPLWLAVRGAEQAICDRDLCQLGVACERQWAFAS